MKWQLIGALVGNVLEMYDFGIFTALTAQLGGCFFPPEGGDTVQLLATLGVFASGMLARPLGGVLFGYIGDTHGRKPALLLSVLLMAFSTLAIGLLPCYSLWGYAAPALLFLFRLGEGLSVGGELIGGVLMMIESAPSPDRRALYGSSVMATAGGGIVLGFLVVAALRAALPGASEEQWTQWLWRVPFLLGIVAAAFALWVRKYLAESPEFTERVAAVKSLKPENPLRLAFRDYKTTMLMTFGVLVYSSFGTWVGFWMPLYSLTLVPPELRLRSEAAVLVSLAVTPFFTLWWGHVADYVGSLRLMLASAAIMALMSPVFFALAASGSFPLACLGFVAYSFVITAYVGPLMVWMAEAFVVEARFSAVAFSFNMALAIVGGASQLIMTSVVVHFPERYIAYPALLVSITAIISFVCCILSHFFLRSTQNFASGFCNIERQQERQDQIKEREQVEQN